MAATAPSQAQWAVIIRQQNSLARQLERKIRLLMELQRERKSEARESLEASSPPDPGDPQDGATRVRSCRRRTRAPAASHPSAAGMAQTSSCEVCDVPKGQARTGDSIQEIENRGNELKDLLQRQGITEIVTSKRTHFCAEKAALGAERSGISRIVGGRYRSHHCALSGQRLRRSDLRKGSEAVKKSPSLSSRAYMNLQPTHGNDSKGLGRIFLFVLGGLFYRTAWDDGSCGLSRA